MKKALRLALIYLINLIAGTILGTVLYSLYLNLLGFVAGREINLFRDAELFQALFFVMFCMLILIIPLISYYRIRHPGGILQFVVYIVLCALTWALLMPCSFKLRDFCERRFVKEVYNESLSPNYFRRVDNDVYFFTREFSGSTAGSVGVAPAVKIDTREYGVVEYEDVKDYSNFPLNRKAYPFREIQLKKIFNADENPLPFDFKSLQSMIEKGYSFKLSNFLMLVSFVLLLCSVYGTTNLFDWRLLNSVMLFIITAAIISINSVYFASRFNDIKTHINGIGPFKVLGGIVSEPLLFVVNIFFALIFIISGTIRFIIHKHSKK